MFKNGKIAVASFVAIAFLSGCAGQSEQTPAPGLPATQEGAQAGFEATQEQNAPNEPSDPRLGWVDVFPDDTLTMRCKGTTLIIRESGFREPSIAVVPLAYECMN